MIDNEKFRFILGGIWNSLFFWMVFSAALTVIGPAHLWVVSAVAHLVSTTQAFFVQRHLVFRNVRQPIWLQFSKFQISYLMLLGVSGLVVNALSAQHIHPLIAQLVAIALVVVCGFILGKSFTFSPAVLSFDALVRRTGQALKAHGLPLIAFFGSIAIFELCWGGRFYNDPTHVGHDFAMTGVALLEGKYWVDANGTLAALFNPPWFTPAWCAGTALYADPQSVFYSPLQLFVLWVDPIQATHLNLLLFAAVAYWGGYGLARRILNWSAAPAVVFATLGMANTLLPLRSAVGEAGFQPFYVWTLIALALCWPAGPKLRQALVWPSVAVALGLTAWLQFGFAGMLVPGFLAVLLFCLVLAVLGRADFWILAARSALGGALAVVLNASKLYESISLMRNFPRDFYALPGFASLHDALISIPLSLFQPSEWTYFFGKARMSDVRWAVLPHEWAMSFGLGALTTALGYGFVLMRSKRHEGKPRFHLQLDVSRALALSSALLILVIPVLLLWNQGSVRGLIKQIPILSSTVWPMRWIVLYIPLVQLLLALPVRGVLARAAPSRRAWLLAGAALVLIWLGPLLEPADYYLDPNAQGYDPKPVLQAYAQSTAPIPITRVTVQRDDSLGHARNDTMLDGASQGLCYNPIYGYRLESFPQMERLRDGPALDQDEHGQSLIYNPACLVHPAENACVAGDGFRLNEPLQRLQAESFLARHPYAWKRPSLGVILAWISQACFWMLLTLLALRAWRALLRLAQSTDADEPSAT